MSPKHWKEFASGDLTRLLAEKILPAKLCKWTEMLTLSPASVLFIDEIVMTIIKL